MTRILASLVAPLRSLRTRFFALSRLQQAVVGIVLIIALFALSAALRGEDTATTGAGETKRAVMIVPLGELQSTDAPLSLTGKVTSVSEAIVRAESSGRMSVYRKLGDFVPAGGIIGEFENATERAQVLSAEGAYQAAQAARDIARINRGSAGNALSEARTGALNTLSTVYTTLDDVIRQKTDALWTNPKERNAKLIPTVSDFKLVIALEAERVALEGLLIDRESKLASLSTASDLSAELTAAESELRRVSKYLDDLSLALSRAIPDQQATVAQIEGWKAVVGGVRQNVNGMLTAVSASRTALSNATAASEIAERNAGVSEGVAAAEAQVVSALGNLRAAQARLEKTIVRSPISGTINSLSAKTGDFLSPFSEVAVVANNSALEVLAYVSEDDARSLVVGSAVDIDGRAKGILTKIPGALEPKTRLIELKIGITEGAKSLVNGESVRIAISRPSSTRTSQVDLLFVPISAVKITPSGNFLFTVTASSTLSALPVDIGAIRGESIEVRTDLPRETPIVTDARGLKDGQEVVVAD